MIDRQKLFWVYIHTFLVTVHLALLIYIGSTFLSYIFGQNHIWIIYSLGAFFTLVLDYSITPLLKKIELEKINKFALWVATLNMIGLAFAREPIFIFICYVVYIVLSEYHYLLSSLMVEDVSKNKQTGEVRGRFLSMLNLGYLLSPFLASFLITHFSMQSVFLVSSFFTLGALFVSKNYIRTIPRIVPQDLKWKNTLKDIWKNYDVRTALLTNISFYIGGLALIVYLPFKLTEVGISMTSYLTVILPIALLNFVIVPMFLGHVEDKHSDEKQFLIFAFFGLAVSLYSFTYFTSNSVLLWTVLVFMMRFFGSIAETSVNSYFFKKVQQSNTAVIAIFSSSKQIAYLFVTPILSFLLYVGNLNTIFLSVAFYLCFMIVLISKIHGTENYEKHLATKKINERVKRRI